MKKTALNIPEPVRHQWLTFLAHHSEVRSVILFGSRARGDCGERSDIDVAISAPRITPRQWLTIALFLEDETNSLLSVDAVRWENASIALKKKIREEGRVFYERR